MIDKTIYVLVLTSPHRKELCFNGVGEVYQTHVLQEALDHKTLYFMDHGDCKYTVCKVIEVGN